MKMSDILGFPKFYESVKETKLPFKLAYHLAKISEAIASEQSFYQEHLTAIIKEYGETDANGQIKLTEDGQGVVLKPDTQAECEKKIQELQDLDVDLHYQPLKIEEVEALDLTTDAMRALMPFIEE